MRFILTGFTQDIGFRVFAFARTGDDAVRTEYTVRADLGLIRRYEIRVQELPLLCRGLLERREPGDETRSLTLTEEEMCLYAKDCAATRHAAAQKRKPARRPLSENTGAAWRGHPRPVTAAAQTTPATVETRTRDYVNGPTNG
jgi:hypothetical protein